LARTSWSWTAEHRLPSDTHATSIAVADLLDYLQSTGWSEREVFGIHMAVEEALVNAIQHGNKEDPTKSVHVAYRATPQRLRIEITDEGPGFRPAEVADPTCGELLCEPHGRGLLLMRAYMSKVEYLGRGNHLVMEKRRSRKQTAA
jgi:serine/threonine-protein kinase RsbW